MLSFVKTVLKILNPIPVLVLLVVLWVVPCPAMEGRATDVHNVSGDEAGQIRRKMAVKQGEIEAFSEKETAIIEGLNEAGIDVALNRMGAEISHVNRELQTVKTQMTQVMDEKKILAATIDKNSDYVGTRLRALYRVRMIGRMGLTAMPESMFDFFLQQNALEKILAQDFKLMDSHMVDMEHLAAQTREFSALEKEKQRLEASLVEQMRVKKKDGERRRIILEEIQKKKRLGLAAVASLKAAAEALEKKMAVLQAAPPGDKEGFSLSQGRLGMPVQGAIITPYGPSQNSNYSSFTFEAGIDIRADKGEPVRSVFKGEVIYAEWLKGYGNLMIINHGDNFYTLYAHVEEFFKKKGERVDTDEVIALAGDTGSIKGICLHFEVRHHGRPVDPMKWLKKGA